jgi:signal transduction histidine kinase
LLEKKINEQTNDLKNTISALRATKQNLNQQIENNTKIIQYITHDIKSPLKFMAMASKYMYDSFEENDPDLKENIQSIFTSSSQMFNFVDNLLEYSKVYLDKGELYIEEFKPHEVISQKISLFESIATSKKITIKNLIEKNTTLKGNKQLFSIIIHNLLDNALKNTPYGSILFNALVDEEQTYISISDTGDGMDQSVIDYYHDLIDHYDAERSKQNKKIGLHIIIELLLILNGRMHIESGKNNGTVITLTFNNNG